MKRKKINSKSLAIIFSTLLLFTISLFLIFDPNYQYSNKIDKTEVLEGAEDDNWEISVVFYDSTVNNGNTPLTEINWHSDNKHEERIIKVQINYKNTNSQIKYNPNDISIEMSTFRGRNTGNCGNYRYGLPATAISAGTLEDGYDWNGSQAYSRTDPHYTFKNNTTIDEHTNFEGSIQLTYSLSQITYFGDLFNDPKNDSVDATTFKNNFTEKLTAKLKYKNKLLATSNELKFTYTSEKQEYGITKVPSNIKALDGFENANDYIWVKWYYRAYVRGDKPRMVHYPYVMEYVPEGAVAYDEDMSKIDVVNNSFRLYTLEWRLNDDDEYYGDSSWGYTRTYYIGYPKELYDQQRVNNTIKMFGTYEDETEEELIAEHTQTIDLTNYEFTYSGALYSITKNSGKVYTKIANEGLGTAYAGIIPRVIYTGQKYDLIISDDVLVFPMEDGTYKILDDSQYSIKKINTNPDFYTGNGVQIKNNDVDIYVRYANTSEYVRYPLNIKADQISDITFPEDNIVGIQVIVKDLECGIGSAELYVYFNLHTSGIASTGTAYNLAYIQIRQGNEIVNTPGIESYGSNAANKYVNIAEYDLEHYGMYMQRAVASMQLIQDNVTYSVSKRLSPYEQPKDIPLEQLYRIESEVSGVLKFDNGLTNNYYGQELIDLLPEGMDVYYNEEQLFNALRSRFLSGGSNHKFKLKSGRIFNSRSEFWEYYKTHLTVKIIENYKGSNRTFMKIRQDFTDDPLIVSPKESVYHAPHIYCRIYYSVTYDNLLEYGINWENSMQGFLLNYDQLDFTLTTSGTQWKKDTDDINENGDTNEKYYTSSSTTKIISALETHQDVQTSVQSTISNYSTGKVKVAKNDEYNYKLRVRTGRNDVTNLVIYDSLEDYAKNPQLEIVKASGGNHYWQGDFVGVDTSYAESQGYHVKVFYNENPNPGTLTEDNTWQEYTASTDKTKVKALAFKYLSEGGTPAVLSANSNTYVVIKMKSPDVDYKTFSYNGCWTEWNAIEPVTGRPVDFITGINSNIVKVALPTSVEPEDINITIKKEWKDGNNTLGVRPNTINVKLIANDDYANAVEVPMTGTGNSWTTTVTVPRYDADGETINYTVREDNITIGEYHYSSTVNNYTITNSLNRDLTLTKVWKDNTNAYLTRPSNVTFKVKQNGNDYKTVTFGGSLTDNEWTETITVPVYDNNGNAYNYTIDELNISNYTSTCTEFTCTNTLTGDDNITITKVWVDNNNEYQTRPNNISIRLKQNGNAYQSIDLTGTTNTWTSDEITVPMYDNEGVKYTYTVDETPISGYGIVEYDQADLKVTNTLKENKAITITKKWIDDSNSLGLRPNELKINLLQNGNNYQEITLSGDTDTWSTTIEVPKYDNNQKEYTYSIKELVDNINNDYSNISYSEEELSVTNKLEAKTDITISKIWDDNDNELKTRPDKITINLLRNGEQFQKLEIIPDDIQDNTWSVTVEDLDVYDNNGAKYTYTIEESLIDQLERYETITYDQTNFKITNKLTVPPKVTLFFTVKNGYTLPGTEEILYDQEGYNDALSRYNLNGEDEYIFTFELENIDTGEIIEGRLSTQGTLEFDDVPYGTYRAREGEDDYFSFVSMIEIEEVLGVTFTEDEMGGTITITPTGKDIIYGANITNKIEILPKNPETKTNNTLLIISIIILTISLLLGIKVYKKFSFLK